jgi:hypothetical protein
MTEASASSWLVLAYTLPPDPSRLRVSLWRRLRKIGAIYVNEGFWLLPCTPRLQAEIRRVVEDVRSYQGTASAFVSSDLDDAQNQRFRTLVQDARDAEYRELKSDCIRFLSHIDKSTAEQRFSFSETDEIEEELNKIDRWIEQIVARDVFGAPEKQPLLDLVEQCRAAFQGFAETAVGLTERTVTATVGRPETPGAPAS